MPRRRASVIVISVVADLPTRGGAEMRSGRKSGCEAVIGSGSRPLASAIIRRASAQNDAGMCLEYCSSVLCALLCAALSSAASVSSSRFLAAPFFFSSESRRSLAATIVLRYRTILSKNGRSCSIASSSLLSSGLRRGPGTPGPKFSMHVASCRCGSRISLSRANSPRRCSRSSALALALRKTAGTTAARSLGTEAVAPPFFQKEAHSSSRVRLSSTGTSEVSSKSASNCAPVKMELQRLASASSATVGGMSTSAPASDAASRASPSARRSSYRLNARPRRIVVPSSFVLSSATAFEIESASFSCCARSRASFNCSICRFFSLWRAFSARFSSAASAPASSPPPPSPPPRRASSRWVRSSICACSAACF